MVMVKDIPYAPSTDERLNVMLELAETAPNQTMVDLGSGDGKVVIAFAKKGAYRKARPKYKFQRRVHVSVTKPRNVCVL